MAENSPERVENAAGKGGTACYKQFLILFKRLVLQTRKNKGLFGKGLKSHTLPSLILTMLEPSSLGFVDIADQDQTACSVQPDH